jgi:hypothetical protein
MSDISQQAKTDVYLHIGNGGVTFAVEDSEYGPKTAHTEVFVTTEGLVQLAELFVEAARRTYSEPYCCAATAPNENCAMIDGDGTCSSADDFGDVGLPNDE